MRMTPPPVLLEWRLRDARLITRYGQWCLFRHGGGAHHTTRLVLASHSEEKARSAFGKLARRMRRGSVLLLDPSGALAAFECR